MKMRSVVITATMLLILPALAAAVSAEPIDGPTVLKRMLEAEGSVAFTAHQVTTLVWRPSLTSEQIVYRAGFRGMRIEYIKPPALGGEVMADDGRVLEHLIPKANVLKIGPSRLAALKMRTEQAAQGFRRGNLRVELIGKDRVADRTAYLIEVKPKLRRGPTRKFWVDAEKWVKLKTEDIAPDGTAASMSYYTRIDFLNTIPDEKFHIEPPPGVQVKRQAIPAATMPLEKARELAGFRVLEPTYLPPGFKLAGAAVQPFRRGQLVIIRYTDGVSSFSLFETPGHVLKPKFLARLHEGPVRPGKGIYSWKEGDLNLTIVGQLPMNQIRKIAASVK